MISIGKCQITDVQKPHRPLEPLHLSTPLSVNVGVGGIGTEHISSLVCACEPVNTVEKPPGHSAICLLMGMSLMSCAAGGDCSDDYGRGGVAASAGHGGAGPQPWACPQSPPYWASCSGAPGQSS